MKLLITLAGSLRYDSRVKRHAASLAPCFGETEILCQPIDEAYLWPQRGDIRQSFAPVPTLRSGVAGGGLAIRARALGLLPALVCAFPWAALSLPAPPHAFDALCHATQDTQLADEALADVRGAVCLPDSPNDLVNLMATLGGWLDMAACAADIPADVVLCNDLDTLLCGVAHKLRHGSRLVYDAHEIYFDQTVGQQPRLWKNTLALLERELIQHADHVMGVSGSLVEWLRGSYAFSAPATVLPNISLFAPPQPYAPKQLAGGQVRLCYHGVSDDNRGIEALIEALPLLPPGYSSVLRLLPSDNVAALHTLADGLCVAARVAWPDVVPAEDIIPATRQDADIGVFTPSPAMAQCVNYRVVLANKLIEYLKAGLPVISTPWPEHTRILNEYGAGVIVPDGSGTAVAQAAQDIAQDPVRYTQMSAAALRAADDLFGWDTGEKKLQQAVGVNV